MSRFLLAFLLLAAPAFAQAPQRTTRDATTVVERWVDDNGRALLSGQNRFHALRGRYFQGLAPLPLPAEDADGAADYTRRPSHQIENWSNVFRNADALPARMPMEMRIDVYEGPRGPGWVIRVRIRAEGKVLRRAWDFGREGLSTGWEVENAV